MLTAFGDDSADGKLPTTFAFGGLAATEDVMDAAVAEWVDCTDGGDFHSAACESSNGKTDEGVPQTARDDKGGSAEVGDVWRLNEVVRGKRDVTADTELHLAQPFKTTAAVLDAPCSQLDLKAAIVRRPLKLTRRAWA